MISTQPGSTPVASFKIVALDEVEPYISYAAGNDCGWLRFLSSLCIINDVIYVSCEVFRVMKMKTLVFWVIMLLISWFLSGR